MSPFEFAVEQVEAMHLRCDIHAKVIGIMEDACMESEEDGQAKGHDEGWHEGYDTGVSSPKPSKVER